MTQWKASMALWGMLGPSWVILALGDRCSFGFSQMRFSDPRGLLLVKPTLSQVLPTTQSFSSRMDANIAIWQSRAVRILRLRSLTMTAFYLPIFPSTYFSPMLPFRSYSLSTSFQWWVTSGNLLVSLFPFSCHQFLNDSDTMFHEGSCAFSRPWYPCWILNLLILFSILCCSPFTIARESQQFQPQCGATDMSLNLFVM